MTDYETKYRDLVAGLRRTIAAAEGSIATPGNYEGEPIRNYVMVADLRALLAPSPAERGGEPDGCRLNGCHPAPVSSGEAGHDTNTHVCSCGTIDHYHAGDCNIWLNDRPAPVVTPNTEGSEQA